jgi:hypothetical protein
MPDQGTLRTARTVFFTAVCLLLSTVGHAVAASDTPAPAALLAGAGLVFLGARRFTGRELSQVRLIGAVGASQLGLHGLFSYVPLPGGPAYQPLSQHAGHPAADSAGMVHAAPSMTVGMVAAHVLAGLLVAWWLRRGEALLWSLCRRLAAALPLGRVLVRVRIDPLPVWASALPAPARAFTPVVLLLSHAVSRRGPPVPA